MTTELTPYAKKIAATTQFADAEKQRIASTKLMAKVKSPFPGFEDATKKVSRDIRLASKKLEEAEQALATHSAITTRFLTSDSAMSPAKIAERARQVKEGLIPAGQSEWQTRKNELLSIRLEAVKEFGRTQWFSDFYGSISGLVQSGYVTDLDSYLTLMKSNPEGILTESDMKTAQDVIDQITAVKEPESAREDAPDWLKPTAEQETEIRKVFALEPKPPESIHRISVNELVKSMTNIPKIDSDTMSSEEILKLASIMDIPVEDVQKSTDIMELINPYALAISEREAKLKEVLAGRDEWEMPQLSGWQSALFYIAAPMQGLADLMKPYIEHVSYPVAGFWALAASKLTLHENDIEIEYAQKRAMGYNWWDSLSEGYQDWDLPWYLKLGIELVTDPANILDWGLMGGAGTLLKKIPSAFVRRIGSAFIAFNKGYLAITDLPFDAFKAMWSKLPKSFSQETKMQSDMFRNLLISAASESSGKIEMFVTADDLIEALQKSVVSFANNPTSESTMAKLGGALMAHAPLGTNDILIWSKSLKGGLANVADITDDIIESVEDVVSDSLFHMITPEQGAKKLALAMDIEDTPANLGKIIKDVKALIKKSEARVPTAIEIGKTAKFSALTQMTDYLMTTQRKIISATARSKYASGKQFSGIVLGLMNKVDTLERGVWRQTLDRWLVRPAAEAYLGSIAYPIWNVFESIGVSILEGVVPAQAKREAYQRMFMGLLGVDPQLAAGSAGDMMNLIRTMPGRADSVSVFAALRGESGPISFMPGKLPADIMGKQLPKWISGKDYLEWTSKKFVELNDVWSNGLKRNFMIRKMADYLAEYSYDVAGQDLNALFTKLIKGNGVPVISKKSLGLTTHELEQEMFQRLTTGLKSEVLGVKDIFSNNNLMRGEAVKILRQATELSPSARSLGEQLLNKGSVLKTTDDVLDFCQVIAKQSIDDVKSYPMQVPDAFKFMADQIENPSMVNIKSSQDLMQIFQHFEVMSETASHVPSKLLSQVMEEADEMKRLGQFRQLETLWRTSRVDVEDAVDSIRESLTRVKTIIQSKSGLLPEVEQNALNALLERTTARVQLQEQFLKFDGRLLDDFWALPKELRNAEAHTELRAYRLENILKYKGEDAVLGAGDFLERKNYSALYNKLPAQKLFKIDATNRALSADDCAKVMGCNVDALTTGLLESMAVQEKPYFVQIIKQFADSNPSYYKGFTEEKIGKVYDNILAGLKMSPEVDIATQKILQQVEGVKQKMLALKMNRSLTPAEETALGAWVDNVANGMDEIFGKEIAAIPDITFSGLTDKEQKFIEDTIENIPFDIKIRKVKFSKENKMNQLVGDEIRLSSNWDADAITHEAIHTVLDEEVNQGNKKLFTDFVNALDEADAVEPYLREEFPKAVKKIALGEIGYDDGQIIEDLHEWFVENLSKYLDNPESLPLPLRNYFDINIPKFQLYKKSSMKLKGIITADAWQEIRQKASESAHKEYYKAFADYTNQNIIDALGKTIYPFWTYHMYRWFFLGRTFLRHPAVTAAWGKYYEYSDQGYTHIPGTDLEFNPFSGSAFGITFSLARSDFKSYYENLGVAGDILDKTQRLGFYPGIQVTLPIALTPILSGRAPELGNVLAPIHTVGLNLFANSKIPGVADAAKWLKSKIFHENFNDYYTATIVSTMQVKAGGKLISGQSGTDLWFKMMRGEKLSAEEQSLWNKAGEEAGWIEILKSEFPNFRLRGEEMLDAYKQVTSLIEAQTGMTVEFQDNLWKHNLKPTDVIGVYSLELQSALDQMWQWRIYFGRGSILLPPEYSNLQNKISNYYNKIESYQQDRLAAQSDSNKGFLQPSKTLHFNGGEWRQEYASNWSKYVTRVDSLSTDPEFSDAMEAMTVEGQIRLAKELGFAVPSTDPMTEAIRIYFEIEMKKKVDPYTGEEDYDYLGFWVERESVRMALPEDQREEFDTYIRRYQTPMEVLFKQVNNDYLRGYNSVSRIVLQEFSDEEKALIAEYYADSTSMERKEQIKNTVSHSGDSLISSWDRRRSDIRSALRRSSPQLDFWLYVFGYTSSASTPESAAMISAWEQDKTSIVRNITESPILDQLLAKEVK